ncbi:hypothetical protein GCM10007159_01880 [Modicisalibacter luteus]|nr:hypothetical protein GCM10007159_01880 [Halomonas lutea]
MAKVRRLADKLTQRYPDQAFGWKWLGLCLTHSQRTEDAIAVYDMALSLHPGDTELLLALGKANLSLHRWEEATDALEQALTIHPDIAHAHLGIARARFGQGKFLQAVDEIDKAYALLPNDDEILTYYITIRAKARRFDGMREKCHQLISINKSNPSLYTLVGNKLAELGHFDEAEQHFQKALTLDSQNVLAFSSLVFNLHYNPAHNAEYIHSQILHWGRKLSSAGEAHLEHSTQAESRKRLRLGLISAGLRSHPVGLMITTVLEALPVEAFEVIAYPTNDINDHVTARLKQCVQYWHPIASLDAEALANKLRSDKIDILFDLSGHGDGNRLDTLVRKPAPLIIKWVGGLVNTTGLEAIDYLLSDVVETPPGIDDAYLEKLIRLPDDYICYMPPEYAPNIQSLPALANGHVTFGCFNNPAKINDVLLIEWAQLLQSVPDSRLLLKGAQYDDQGFCNRIFATLKQQGVEAHRVIMEGPAGHKEFLEAYNQVDIALDSWPYSGGLTTCEALLMGVPVVTMPGPTFAGRHSATHLVNAGMPELVTNSWDEYRARVIELASDLDSLSTIRTHLRDVLLQSPVCDGPRFAKHFTTAMRAIWQRYCEGKSPAALTLDKEGIAQFEDEDQPVEITHPEALEEGRSEFSWQFKGKIIAINNGGQLLHSDVIRQMLQNKTLELIVFDPASHALDTSLKNHEGVHYYPNTTLGNGQPGALYACLDPKLSASLKPLQGSDLPEDIAKGSQILTQVPLSTIALDKVEGLPAIDWLVLDAMNDSAAILENGGQALKDALLIQAKVVFQNSHERQPNLAEMSHWASRHGFRFYRLHEPQHRSRLPKDKLSEQCQATELVTADALYLPSQERLTQLNDNQLTKLAFVLRTMYGVKDLTYELLSQMDETRADQYLAGEEATYKGNLSSRDHFATLLTKTAITPPSIAVPNQHISEYAVMVDVRDLPSFILQDPTDIVVLMPTIDTEKGLATARILKKRAGTDCNIILLHDTVRQGFIKTINDAFKYIETKYIVYLAEDAFPGRNWLRYAYQTLEKSGKGLLAFNDGKWNGLIASFGMVRRDWIIKLYNGSLFYSGYQSHAADDELTILARANGEHIYSPEATLIEVDPEKDFVGKANRQDRLLLQERFFTGFDQLASLNKLKKISKDYGIDLRDKRLSLPNGKNATRGYDSIEKRSSEPDIEVSIVIPAFKPRWFEEALLSALSQDYSSFEVVVCDDCPTDGIREIVMRYLSTSRVPLRYFRNEKPLGEIENITRCIRESRGKFIKPLYDDDTLSINSVKNLVSVFYNTPNTALASSQRNIIDEKGALMQSKPIAYQFPFDKDTYINGEDLVSLYAHGLINFIGEPTCVMFRKSLVEHYGRNLFLLGGEDIYGRADLAAWMNILRSGNLVMLKENLSSFRISAEQSSHTSRQYGNQEGIRTFCRMIRELGWHKGNKMVRISPLNAIDNVQYFDFIDFWKKTSSLNKINQAHSPREKNKIFCIGRNKTGTTSLQHLFFELGYVVGDQREAERLADTDYFDGYFHRIIKYCENAQFFQDVPFSLPETYKHVDKAFPGSKFILTIRDNSEQWYQSLLNFHIKKFSSGAHAPTKLDLQNSGYISKDFLYKSLKICGINDNDLYNKSILKRHYDNYNSEVIKYFEGRDNFIVINISKDEDLPRLLEFLGISSTRIKNFPWLNKS